MADCQFIQSETSKRQKAIQAARKITPRERRFLRYYIERFNASWAAEKMGYSPGHGSHILRIPRVREALAAMVEYEGLTNERIVAEFARHALNTLDLADVEGYLEQEQNPETSKPTSLRDLRAAGVNTSAIESVSIGKDGERKITRVSPVQILIGLAKLRGVLVERHEVETRQAGPVRVQFNIATAGKPSPAFPSQIIDLPEPAQPALPEPAVTPPPATDALTDKLRQLQARTATT